MVRGKAAGILRCQVIVFFITRYGIPVQFSPEDEKVSVVVPFAVAIGRFRSPFFCGQLFCSFTLGGERCQSGSQFFDFAICLNIHGTSPPPVHRCVCKAILFCSDFSRIVGFSGDGRAVGWVQVPPVSLPTTDLEYLS